MKEPGSERATITVIYRQHNDTDDDDNDDNDVTY